MSSSDSSRRQKLKELLSKLGVPEECLELLEVALTHPTFAFEHQGTAGVHNQRLEFLGDAVLGLVVGEYLYTTYPELPEGELTRMRAGLVCEVTLSRKAAELGLGDYLRLGRGEELSGGRRRPSNLADAFEAVAAALYLAAGLEAARRFVLEQLAGEVEQQGGAGYRDFKTSLQELVQKFHEDNVSYLILEESGPDHSKLFRAGVAFRGSLLAEGSGRSKKEAEQQAARAALAKLGPELEKLP